MWSGPRTLSTAMMRSFAARPDCVVVDEPLYAFYLAHTDIHHPAREAIMASQPQDWATVVHALTRDPLPAGRTLSYQKHMTHHLLPEVDRDALAGLSHAFLLRDPRDLLRSYARVRSTPTLADLGLPQQVEVFERFGGPVLDAADVLTDPRAALTSLCATLGIAFTPAMLSWPAGPHPADGVWAEHWYDGVRGSTGFAARRATNDANNMAREPLPTYLEPLLEQCLPYYETLATHRLSLTQET